MSAIQNIVTGPTAQVFGWALLHLLWQGVLIALLLKILLRGIPARLAGLRYWIASAALLAMLLMPGISIWKAFTARPATVTVVAQDAPLVDRMASISEVAAPRAAPARVDVMVDWQRLARERLGAMAPWLAILWFAGAVLFASVMLGGLIRAQFLKRSATSLGGEAWAGRLTSMRLGSRSRESVRLLESYRVSVPTVIGWLRPAILLPAGAADELATEHLDALLAHELAHIRRRDYPANLIQTFVEVLLWYHPATWWVTLQVRAERECCCDDEAVAVCGNTLTYARALSHAERLRSASKWAIALSGASLLNRVRRLTEMNTPQIGRVAVCLLGLFAIGLILAAGAGSSLLAYVPAFVERPSAVAAPPVSPQVLPQESPKPVGAVPNGQGTDESKAVRKQPAQEKFVRPTEVPQEIKPDPSKFVRPTEIPKIFGPDQWPAQMERYETLLATLRQELQDLKARLDKTHPDVVKLSRLIADLEMQRDDLMKKHAQLQASLGPKVTGYVYDPTGAVVPGVAISLVTPESKVPLFGALSDARGYFEIDSLDGLDFELRFELAGFASQALPSRYLGAGPLGITLELGQIKETVTVITGAPTGGVTAVPNSRIRVGGNIVAPKLIQRADPAYPPEAKANNIEGIVVISALIDEVGQVKDAVVSSGNTLLREAALECVRQWRYSPAFINGQPWPMRLSITVVFKLVR